MNEDQQMTADALSRAIRKIERQIIKENRKLTLLGEELRKVKGETEVTCSNNNFGRGCARTSKIKDLEYIQTHYYIKPHGCNSGDYYLPGEGRFICPHCGHINRLNDRNEISLIKSSFKSMIDDCDCDD